MSATMYVTYEGGESTRFDREYYVREHLRIVGEAWGGHGLVSCAAFFPALAGSGTIAIAECRFRDRAAMLRALDAPETAKVMADVARFTEAVPAQHVPAPVREGSSVGQR